MHRIQVCLNQRLYEFNMLSALFYRLNMIHTYIIFSLCKVSLHRFPFLIMTVVASAIVKVNSGVFSKKEILLKSQKERLKLLYFMLQSITKYGIYFSSLFTFFYERYVSKIYLAGGNMQKTILKREKEFHIFLVTAIIHGVFLIKAQNIRVEQNQNQQRPRLGLNAPF